MRRHKDGSATLNADEVKAVARVLEVGRELAEQMGAPDQGASSNTTEYNLLITIDLLEDLGVSADELTKVLAPRKSNG